MFLVITGALGLLAAFALTVEKFEALEDPGTALSCDFSVIVQCGTNLASAQGAVFGFPNPLIGIVGFTAVVSVGVGILAGARFADWFWALVNLGILGALAFVIWLIAQSIFVLGTLCPWCMVVWAVTIPLAIVVTLGNAASGVLRLGRGPTRLARGLLGWAPVMTLACYIAIAILAQTRLDVLAYL